MTTVAERTSAQGPSPSPEERHRGERLRRRLWGRYRSARRDGSTPAGRYARLDLLRSPAPHDRRVAWVGALLVTALAAVVRGVHLTRPEGFVFDEVYYAQDAADLLRAGVEVEDDGGPQYVVHPPLGKWLIALGIRAFGDDELGWRVAPLVAGTLLVLVTCRVGRRLTGSWLLGCVAGLLVALDGLAVVQSRTSMLDVFLALFLLVAFACLLLDRDTVRSRLAERVERGDDVDTGLLGSGLGLRPWLLAAGVALGSALAVKWTAVYAVAALGLLAVGWEAGARRSAGVGRPVVQTVLRRALPLAGVFLVLPVLVYLASWAGWFASDAGWDRAWADGRDSAVPFVPEALRSLWHYHAQMWEFHTGLSTPHRYESSPWGWLVLARPVAYFYEDAAAVCPVDTCAQEVLAIGNPALWWASIPALVVLLWRWVSRRDWRAAAVLVPVALLLLPWGYYDLADERTMFLFYALPAVPFLAIGVALCCGWTVDGLRRFGRGPLPGAVLVAVYLLVVVALFFGIPGVDHVGLYPLLTAEVLPYESWRARVWFPTWI